MYSNHHGQTIELEIVEFSEKNVIEKTINEEDL